METDIQYPLYDISDFGWDHTATKEHNIIFQNPYPGIVPFGRRRFIERMKKYEFVDCGGRVFKVKDIEFISSPGVKGIFQLSRMMVLHFHKLDRQVTFHEFQTLMINRAKETANTKLEEAAKMASSISDLLKPS